MKKKFIIAILTVLALSVFVLSGCKTSVEKYYDSISEIRDRVYVGSSDTASVTVVSGVHETPFVADGISEKKTDFTVITVTFKEFLPSRIYTYAVSIGGVDYNGVLSMHPFAESYSVELAARATEETLNVNISLGDYRESITAQCIVEEDDISADRALDTAITALKADLKAARDSGYKAEIYIRLIENPINSDGGYFWYVAFIGSDTYAALIDRKSGEVIGIKN